ncbi:hypothetical protein KAR91_14725 [Candidatus Pacearchaeota archaeon]|nr:hypothetical protein [Candidatus Pacearchaeota archaeon]
MANIKRITADWNVTGLTVYCIVRREADNYRLNDADGDFAAAPADPYNELTEDTVIKGRYELDESRVAWDDGQYTVSVYNQAGGSPAPASDTIIATGEIIIKSDLEVWQSGDNFARLGTPAGASIAADLVVIDNFVDELEARLTAARAGYLDELAAGNLPTDIATITAYVDELETRLSAARAGYLDELAAANIPADIDTLIARLTATRSGYLDNLSGGAVALNSTVAKEGADGDTLETLSDQIDAITGLSGARTITLQLYETATTTPIADVAVAIYNSDESLLLGVVVTDTNGQYNIAVDDGTYKLRIRKAGATFTVPETLTVTGDATEIFYGDLIDIGTPSDSDVCRVYDYLYLADGATEEPSPKVRAEIVELPYSKDGKLHSGDIITEVYDSATGLLYWDIVQGAKVSFFIEDFIEVERVVPALSTQRLATL